MQETVPPKETKRRLWRLGGGLALAAALIGALVPLLPTTPFLLLGAYFLTRGSERLHRWLIGPHSLGAGVADFLRIGISRPGKVLTIAALIAAFAVAWLAGLPTTDLVIEGLGLVAVGIYVLTRPSPAPQLQR